MMSSLPIVSEMDMNCSLRKIRSHSPKPPPLICRKSRVKRSHSPQPPSHPPPPPGYSKSDRFLTFRNKSHRRSRSMSPQPPPLPHSRSQSSVDWKTKREIKKPGGRYIPPPPSIKPQKTTSRPLPAKPPLRPRDQCYSQGSRQDMRSRSNPEKINDTKFHERLRNTLHDNDKPFIPSLIVEKFESSVKVSRIQEQVRTPSSRRGRTHCRSNSKTLSKLGLKRAHSRETPKKKHRRTISSPNSPLAGDSFSPNSFNKRRSSDPLDIGEQEDSYTSSDDEIEYFTSRDQQEKIPIKHGHVTSILGLWEIKAKAEADRDLPRVSRPGRGIRVSDVSYVSEGSSLGNDESRASFQNAELKIARGHTSRMVQMLDDMAKKSSWTPPIPFHIPEMKHHKSSPIGLVRSPKLAAADSPLKPKKFGSSIFPRGKGLFSPRLKHIESLNHRLSSDSKTPSSPGDGVVKRRLAASLTNRVLMLEDILGAKSDSGSASGSGFMNISRSGLFDERSNSPAVQAEHRRSESALNTGPVKKRRKPVLKKSVSSGKPERPPLKDCMLEDIINRINHPFNSDEKSKRILFTCYRGFCTRKELLVALEKYYEDPPLPTDFEEYKNSSDTGAKENAKKISRIKLLNLLRYWLREFYYDFEDSDLTQIVNWTHDTLHTNDNLMTKKAVDTILKEVRLIQSGKTRVIAENSLHDCPQHLWDPEIEPKKIFNVPSEEIARQMCLMDHNIFSSIRPHEFLGQSWKKKNKATEAPNILRIIDHFNKITCWTQAMILYEVHLRKRARILSRLLKICHYLDQNGNLNSLCAIMTGIRSTPIFRLKKTFASLKPKHAKLLLRFNELLKSDKNQKNLRQRMATLVQPGIPHVGLFLSDILFIDDGNVNSIQDKINFHKYTLLNERIDWCLLFQSYPFRFRKLEKVQDELEKSFKILPQDFLYQLSLSVEKRAAVQSDII